mmetsp:Transcript_67390/g.121440  ORF Transcript_67390/g.121440 Transcript_67390/m.121440 type:complete len:225 (-) Transcript_67390:63-737(-)
MWAPPPCQPAVNCSPACWDCLNAATAPDLASPSDAARLNCCPGPGWAQLTCFPAVAAHAAAAACMADPAATASDAASLGRPYLAFFVAADHFAEGSVAIGSHCAAAHLAAAHFGCHAGACACFCHAGACACHAGACSSDRSNAAITSSSAPSGASAKRMSWTSKDPQFSPGHSSTKVKVIQLPTVRPAGGSLFLVIFGGRSAYSAGKPSQLTQNFWPFASATTP